MVRAFLAAWRRFPQQMQQQMLRDRLSSFLELPQSDLDALHDILPNQARRPFLELVAALRTWS